MGNSHSIRGGERFPVLIFRKETYTMIDDVRAKKVLEALANGVHPVTGEVFPANSPYNHPEVIRALFFAVRSIHPVTPKKSPEERRRENIQKGRPANSGLPWDDESRKYVASGYNSGVSVEVMASKLLRSTGSIIAELQRQELITRDEAMRLQPVRRPNPQSA